MERDRRRDECAELFGSTECNTYTNGLGERVSCHNTKEQDGFVGVYTA